MKNERSVIFVPVGLSKEEPTLTRKIIEGGFDSKLKYILGEPEMGVLMSVDDKEFLALKEISPLINLEWRVLIGIPGVESPASFLYEEDKDRVISYHSLISERVEPKDKTDELILAINANKRNNTDSDDDILETE